MAAPSQVEYADDELPLPSFTDIFGDGFASVSRYKKRRGKDIAGEEITGRWTADEHRLFLEGIMLYGKDWKRMQTLIKTRSLVQIRTHAQKVFKKVGNASGKKRKFEDGSKEEGQGGDLEIHGEYDGEGDHTHHDEDDYNVLRDNLHDNNLGLHGLHDANNGLSVGDHLNYGLNHPMLSGNPNSVPLFGYHLPAQSGSIRNPDLGDHMQLSGLAPSVYQYDR